MASASETAIGLVRLRECLISRIRLNWLDFTKRTSRWHGAKRAGSLEPAFDSRARRGDAKGMSIAELTARICAFRDARDWAQFHNPKDLAVAIAQEAGELVQPFVWKSPEQAEAIVRAKREEIASEVADVAILLFEFAQNAGISLEQAMLDKLARNEQRYPVEKARGSNAKYNEL